MCPGGGPDGGGPMGGDWDRLFEREFRRRLTGERERDLSFLPPLSPRAGERDRDRRRAGDLGQT